MPKRLFDDFVKAQNIIYPVVMKELAAGKKRHLIGFIYPQSEP